MKRINFIWTILNGSLAEISLLPEAFAELPNETPRAITNKIPKKPLKPFYIKPDKSLTYIGGTKIRFDQVNSQFLQ